MRHARWLLLAALVMVISAVGYIYYQRLAAMPPAHSSAEKMPSGVDLLAHEWHYTNRVGNCPQLDVRAKSFKQIKEPSTFDLEGVVLLLYQDCGKKHNLVSSAKAQFDTGSGTMFSDGEVEIIMNIPEGQEPSDKLVHVKSSGVKFETKSGIATTDRAAAFTFAGGDGASVGAEYDPNKHQLDLKSAVLIHLKPKHPGAKPTQIEGAHVIYLEKESKIVFFDWCKLTRENLTFNAGMSVAILDQRHLKQVEADNAWGVQNDPDRKVEYRAEHLNVLVNPQGQVTNLVAERKAHLVSTSDTARTDVKAEHLQLDFNATAKDSTLTRAVATGKAVVDSNPIAKPNAPVGDTRILRSEVIEMRMRPGGKEIDNAETQGAADLEFVPNRPGVPHRTLKGSKVWVTYAPGNRIQTFRSVNVTTRTDNPPKNNKPQPPVITASQEFRAEFDPKTQQMSRIEQNGNFRYQEGDRKAQSDKGTLDQAAGMMTLLGAARVVDPAGSVLADRIVMNQKTGDFDADGHVNSVRLPDKKGASSAMLNNDEPMQAKADRMISRDKNQLIHYEGKVVAWQGANRIQSDKLDIDRDGGRMKATGGVVSQFVDKPKSDAKGAKPAAASPAFTIVKAPEMTYTEEERVAVYKGGVLLNRPNLAVKSRELKAFLKDKDADSSLDKALLDGGVNFVQAAAGRSRVGTSEHGEYYAGEEKIILERGQPKVVDSLEGTTEGEKLTYFANDDRLLVNGVESRRSRTVLHKNKKK